MGSGKVGCQMLDEASILLKVSRDRRERKREIFSKIQAHMKCRVVAYEMGGEYCKTEISVLYPAGCKLHFRAMILLKLVWYVLAGLLQSSTSVEKAAGPY